MPMIRMDHIEKFEGFCLEIRLEPDGSKILVNPFMEFSPALNSRSKTPRRVTDNCEICEYMTRCTYANGHVEQCALCGDRRILFSQRDPMLGQKWFDMPKSCNAYYGYCCDLICHRCASLQKIQPSFLQPTGTDYWAYHTHESEAHSGGLSEVLNPA